MAGEIRSSRLLQLSLSLGLGRGSVKEQVGPWGAGLRRTTADGGGFRTECCWANLLVVREIV